MVYIHNVGYHFFALGLEALEPHILDTHFAAIHIASPFSVEGWVLRSWLSVAGPEKQKVSEVTVEVEVWTLVKVGVEYDEALQAQGVKEGLVEVFHLIAEE